ncbi:hypothetical protein [Szabonella alba]|uniref:Uncharacterized protein n=1 Tax=Szabonella alba TaxID=2804194 RepID=A0A8K0V5Q4_9RHOB|nr:hypothetical protein [Szabonella alba]MBL4915656.1 hypothetical protein [Szabonella alba]
MLKAAACSIATLVALTVAAPARTVVTPDDCRAEFQTNLRLQGGLASERDALARRPGTAEAIYNACLAHTRGQGGYVAVRASGSRFAEPVVQRRGPRPDCALTMVGGAEYACYSTRFGG